MPLEVLPAGFSLPPPPYLLALIVADAAVAWLLLRRRPPVAERVVLALVPWIVLGSALHTAYQIGAVPSLLLPLLGTPAVYLTVFALAGAVWLAAEGMERPAARVLGVSGTAAAVVAVAVLFVRAGSVRPVASLASLALAPVLAAAAWALLGRLRPAATEATGYAGVLVVFGHALDGVSTAVGVDVLGFGERTPASRAIMEFAAALPTADLIGVGWLFVLVKLAVAAAVVALFVGYVREEPEEGYLLLFLIAATGLGPGVHNLLLYAVR